VRGSSLQLRSVVAAATAIVLALVLVGVGVDVLVSRHLHRSLDRNLRDRAVQVAQLNASAPALLTTPGALDSPLGGTQLSIVVYDRRGRIVARSLSLGGRVLPSGRIVTAAIKLGKSGYADVRSGDQPTRVYAAPLADFGGPAAGGAVLVAAPTQELEQTLGSLHLFIVGSAAAAAVLAALAVFLLLRRALRPLGRLAEAAAEIERTGDSRRRLPEPATDDEVGVLASTLNRMLAGLERVREGERRFLADTSHELRTPLTSLRGNVAYLARHGASPELVAELQADADRLARLVDDLLVLSREEAATAPAEDVRLDRLAHGLDGDDLDVEAGEPVAVRGDRAALERALANLVQNARRYGPAGGRIAVAVEESDGRARVSVTDEGEGLRLDETRLAFTRFWRGRPDADGSGLGLAIVRATAERHGGRAYAEGARFTIELPALRDVSESTGTTREEEPPKGST
jgi:two-component system sensor histidine kinase MprB